MYYLDRRRCWRDFKETSRPNCKETRGQCLRIEAKELDREIR